MLFGNPNDVTISKKILGVQYTCPPGEVIEIPDAVAYVIKVEGVMLVPADELTNAQQSQPSSDAPSTTEEVTVVQSELAPEHPKAQQSQPRQEDRKPNRR